MNQNLDLCPKPSIYAVSQRSKILLSRPNCLNFPDSENSAVFRQMPSDICRSPMPAKLFKSFIHQAFQLLWRNFITECFPSRPAFPSLPLHHPASDAYRCWERRWYPNVPSGTKAPSDYPGLRHIGAVGVTAHMRRDLRKFHAIDAIILLHRLLEVLLPVHRHHQLSILIEPKESGVPVNHRLHLQLRSSGKNALKCFIHIVLHRNHSGTGIGLCRINANQCPGLLKLMVNVDGSVLHIQIMNRQPCELRYTHPRLKQNVHPVIITAGKLPFLTE